MPDLEPLVCIRCVAQVDPTSEGAEGWILVQRSVYAGDRSDDNVWVCPKCSTPLEREAFMAPIEKLRLGVWPEPMIECARCGERAPTARRPHPTMLRQSKWPGGARNAPGHGPHERKPR